MNTPDDQSGIWLTAHYTVAPIYSCRMPMSSIAAAQALPTPGPATVRLALLRTGFELLGETETRERVFPIVRSMAVRIQPPPHIAMSQQTVRGYKATKQQQQVRLSEAPFVREMAHMEGTLHISLNIPPVAEHIIRTLMAGIGYWGQPYGLVWCSTIIQEPPDEAMCLTPLRWVKQTQEVQGLFTALATEFRHTTVEWNDVIPELVEGKSRCLQTDVYVWPLHIIEQRSTGMILTHCPITRRDHPERMNAN